MRTKEKKKVREIERQIKKEETGRLRKRKQEDDIFINHILFSYK